MEESRVTNKSPFNTSLIFAIVITAIVAGSLGYVMGNKTAKSASSSPSSNLSSNLPSSKIAADSIIISQEAVAVGKITKADSNSITIQGKDGKFAGFKLAKSFSIYPLAASNSAAPKPSQDTKTIKLNENYLVHLVLQDSDFVATTIQALTPTTK